jgi:NAD(P)-dependent dehydrogenase (short-subunit alcohol dehydrogenase family)
MAHTYVITGCNRGLGLELARQLSARGERVVATARDIDDAGELRALDVDVHALDVTDPSSVEGLAGAIDGEPIDVLINNAGVGVRSKPFEQVDFDEMQSFFAVNTLGAMRVTRALLPGLRAGEGKKIVNMTSRMGSIADNGSGGAYAYRASKAALNMVTRSLAIDLLDDGFVCVVLHPGWVRTDMGGRGAPTPPEESAGGMIRVIDGLRPQDSGEFFDYKGERVPW